MNLKDQIAQDIHKLEEELEYAFHRLHHHHPHHVRQTSLTFEFNNIKINFKMGQLTVPSGTPVTGTGQPLDIKGNVLKLSAFKPGSCKFIVGAGAGFTLAIGATEDKFILTEITPNTASTGSFTFDAQDVNGVQLPQSTATVTFTEAPVLAVGTQIAFDQVSH